jgi:hypothetical protein
VCASTDSKPGLPRKVVSLVPRIAPGGRNRSLHVRDNFIMWVANVGLCGHKGQFEFVPLCQDWAAKREKFRPLELCFFLTPPFIERIRSWAYLNPAYRLIRRSQ